jgi:methyl-accepting chemotaxis protein
MKGITSSIRLKISLVLGACIILMIVIGLICVRGLGTLSSDMSSMYSGSTVPIEDLAAAQANTLKIRLALRTLLDAHDQDEQKHVANEIRDLQRNFDTAWSDYYPGKVSDDNERKVADRIAAQSVEFKSLTDSILTAIESSTPDAASASLEKIKDVGVDLSGTIDQDIAGNGTEVRQLSEHGIDVYHELLWVVSGAILASLVVAGAACVYLLKAIMGPLDSAVGLAHRITQGQLDNQLAIESEDEFGQLLLALKQMDRQLADIARGIKGSSESIMVASSEIAAGNMDLSSRTEEQAASLEETAASMEQLTTTVRQNSANARQATSLATSASEIADKGNIVVKRMLATMVEITTSSAKIAEITSLIEGIAFQTNILALNAAVEAARAGEQGRGFAVVAGEVRSLAQRSSSAAKEIKDLIQNSVATIQSGSTQAQQVGHTMLEVQQAIKQVADINSEISIASEEQSRGIEQVNQAVSQMDEVTQQNAALVEQASAAAQSLEQLAAQQKRAVAVFKIEEGSSPSAIGSPSTTQSIVKTRSEEELMQRRRSAVTRQPVVALPVASSVSVHAEDHWETF